jgi:hypothetical protein
MVSGYYHSVLASIQLWRRHTLVDELLHEGVLRLTGHDISLRIDAEAVQMEELAGLAPWHADVVSRVWNDLTLETFEIRPKLRGRPFLQRIAATDPATYKRGEARRYNVREAAVEAIAAIRKRTGEK